MILVMLEFFTIFVFEDAIWVLFLVVCLDLNKSFH